MSTTIHKSSLFATLFFLICTVGFSQNTLEPFGKNRIQYKDFDWKVISTPNFEIYYYQNGTELAYFAARYAESDFDRIADLLGYTPYSKTKIFIYNSITDLQQSNVGLNDENVAMGGQTNFVKSRVEIPFTGTLADFKKEVSLGISRMFIIEMMFGGSLRDMVQSSYLLTLPDWFISGAAAYIAEGWSVQMDDYMRDAILNRNLRKPSLLTGQDAVIVGQSIWNFIAERYGKSNISNILNLTRIIRNEENSIASTLGLPYNRFLGEWRKYYGSMAEQVAAVYTQPEVDFLVRKNRRNRFAYNQVSISPDGKQIAYSENLNGRYRVYVRPVDRKKNNLIMTGGYKTINQRFDTEIPLAGWRDNKTLIVIHVKEGINVLSQYDISRGNRRISRRSLENINKILDFDISDDGRAMVLSADRNGKNDIYIYDLTRNAIRPITNDLFDDVNPQFLPNSSSAIVFSSNRQSDSLNTSGKATFREIENHFKLFVYNPNKSTTVLDRIVNSSGSSTQPKVAGDNTVFFLSDENGIKHLYRYNLTNGDVSQVTNYQQSIRSYDVNLPDSSFAFLMLNDGRMQIGVNRDFNFANTASQVRTRRSELLDERLGRVFAPRTPATDVVPAPGAAAGDTAIATTPNQQPSSLVLEEGEVDTDNYQFDYNAEVKKPALTDNKTRRTLLNPPQTESAKNQNINIQGPFPYQGRFSADNVISSVLIDPIRGLGVLFTISMNDVLENHRIYGGVLGFTDLRSSNFFGEYQYLKKRIDYGARFDKKTIFFGREGIYHRYTLNKLQLTASYPFSVSSRVTIAPFYAGTRFTNINNLITPDASTNYGGFRAEYVFDNTSVNGLNMMEGSRAKIRFETYNAFRASGTADASSQSFHSLMIDLRNYKRIHRDIIFATRLAYGQFGGRDPKNYVLGGMDNWVFNQREEHAAEDDPLKVSPDGDNRDQLFLEFVTPLRGFSYNKLYGNKFLLFNAELRFPVIKYFYRGPITSNFFKNFQLVAFTDIGAAWTGRGPFSRQNSLNTTIVGGRGNPFRAEVTNFKNPFLTGVGAGARTLLLGYYVKFDVAWGIEDYVITQNSPRFYLTLGYDF